MQERRPAEPEIGSCRCDVVQHGQGVGEILLVATALDGLNALQGGELRQDVLQQPGLVHQPESHGRTVGHQHLVKFLGYALL